MSITAETKDEQTKAQAGAPLQEEDSTLSIIELGYPLPLIETEFINESCLTATDLWAFENTWKYLKNHWRRYALELYIDFYTENHDLINRFRDKSNKISAHFSEHAYSIFMIFQEVIENGLQNWTKTQNFIDQMSKCHVMHSISIDDLTLLVDAVKDLLLTKCDGLTTPTLRNALNKLFEEIFEQHRQRELRDDDDVSSNMDE